MSQWFKGKDCPVCGKTFYPESLVKWGWKNPKGENVCSYSCQRKSEKNPKSIPKPQRKRRMVKIIETGQIFDSVGECAAFLHTNNTKIYNCLNHNNGRFENLHLERVMG